MFGKCRSKLRTKQGSGRTQSLRDIYIAHVSEQEISHEHIISDTPSFVHRSFGLTYAGIIVMFKLTEDYYHNTRIVLAHGAPIPMVHSFSAYPITSSIGNEAFPRYLKTPRTPWSLLRPPR